MRRDVPREEFETRNIGCLCACRAVATVLLAHGWGRIINIGGGTVRRTGSIGATVRNTSVVALSKNLADELGPRGIRVNVMLPGTTITEEREARLHETAARREGEAGSIAAAAAKRRTICPFATAADIGDIVLFAASGAGRIINGEVLTMGGGAAAHIFHFG